MKVLLHIPIHQLAQAPAVHGQNHPQIAVRIIAQEVLFIAEAVQTAHVIQTHIVVLPTFAVGLPAKPVVPPTAIV